MRDRTLKISKMYVKSAQAVVDASPKIRMAGLNNLLSEREILREEMTILSNAIYKINGEIKSLCTHAHNAIVAGSTPGRQEDTLGNGVYNSEPTYWLQCADCEKVFDLEKDHSIR